jgi:hypothetical protein
MHGSRNAFLVFWRMSPLKKQPELPILKFQINRSRDACDRRGFSTFSPVFPADISIPEDQEIAIVSEGVPGGVERGVSVRAAGVWTG